MRQDDMKRRDEEVSRKRIGFAGLAGVGVLLLLLGFNAPTYAQRDQQGQDGKGQKQEQQAQPQQHAQAQPQQHAQAQQQQHAQAQPQQHAQAQPQQHAQAQPQQHAQAQPQQHAQAQPQQHAQAQPQQHAQAQPQQHAQAQPQQHAQAQPQQHAQAQPQQRQANRPSQQGQRVQQTQEAGVWQQHRATNWQSQHRTWQQRGGYDGYRIPDDHFRGYFGVGHSFRIYSQPLVIFGGYPSFQYGGFWFSILDPWPEYWAANWYDNDDVYIDYYGDGYYLYNRRYPGDRIAVQVYLGD